MMMAVDAKAVESTVLEAVQLNNELLPKDRQLSLDVNTALIGKGAVIDSLALVNLLVSVEQAVSDKFGREITIASERAMSRKSSPFRTTATLIEFVAELLSDEAP
jgi:acyl carrier protein